MINFTMTKRAAALFVADLLLSSRNDLPSITITLRGKSEVCFVSIATDTLSADIVKDKALLYLSPLTITSYELTQAG